MAEKPTVRIPLWASGGTTTDPGGAKEATGWIVSEKPPATWFNWLFNSIGLWVNYLEDNRYACRVKSGTVPQVYGQKGTILLDATTPIGYSGSEMYVFYDSDICGAYQYGIVTCTPSITGAASLPIVVHADMYANDTIAVRAYNSAGTQINLSTSDYEFQIQIEVVF